jgi:prepilin-type processing-associated H-X9-DG protein
VLRYSTFTGPVIVNPKYAPRLEKVGVQASNKVFAADGTRYLPSAEQILDFDLTADPTFFGSFTDSGPTFHGSAAYGRASSGALTPQNQQLSARHGTRDRMNVAYYDGHVAITTLRDAWKNPVPWWPGGSTFNGIQATPESQQFLNTPDKRVIP